MNFENFQNSLEELRAATPLTKYEKSQKLASQIDFICRTLEGVEFIYNNVSEILEAGFFTETSWENPDKLVPILVKGTLKAGHPTTSYEIISELRMLAISKGKIDGNEKDAAEFLEEVVVNNLEFAFKEINEETRQSMQKNDIQKVFNLFDFLLDNIELSNIKSKLAEEVHLICSQRPVVTRKARSIIKLIAKKIDLSGSSESDKKLKFYTEALQSPGKLATKFNDPEDYVAAIKQLSLEELKKEAEVLAEYMRATGLNNPYLAEMLLFLVAKHADIVPLCLGLNQRGVAEWQKHQEFVGTIINENISRFNYLCIYGLARMLERGLLSRSAVKAGFNNMRRIQLDSDVEVRILKSVVNKHPEVHAKQYLIAACLQVLGQPLGVGQGNNSTCQSARGISMWSSHAPAKLLNMITTVATRNNLIWRFENDDLESIKLPKGLVDQLDYNLDAVSVVIVPHLDKIYNEMMRRASGRTEDPHKWVNPALYGQWIQIGFASVYDNLSQSILDFNGFLKTFYMVFHPHYNGNRQMIYPNPIGIFVTSSRGDMLGFHAISLLRVSENPENKEIRAYFLNPNNEGRQDWGQEIKPSVYGNGEKRGESSLPFYQFAARIYAFHYNTLELDNENQVPEAEIEKVRKLAKDSWGKSYIWNDMVKQW
ncbi:MAG: hypothetical protein EA412_02355 [Chitinophagaceae bacterium]|nr:MAG: hypothetical protein EA412_02355 [Chitinophagaceae bacterium]